MVGKLKKKFFGALRRIFSKTLCPPWPETVPAPLPHNMVNFGLLTAEICWRVWGTLRISTVLSALLHGTLVVGVSQTLRR